MAKDDGWEAAPPVTPDTLEETVQDAADGGGALVRGSCPGPRSQGSAVAKVDTVVEVIEWFYYLTKQNTHHTQHQTTCRSNHLCN